MDPNTDKVVYWITQFWSFLSVAFCVYLGGTATKRLLHIWVPAGTPEKEQPTWYRLWSSTLKWHPFAVGSLFGLVTSIPAPNWVPDVAVARMMWFGLSGGFSGQLYGAVKDSVTQIPNIVRSLVSKYTGATAPAPADSEPPASDPPSDPG